MFSLNVVSNLPQNYGAKIVWAFLSADYDVSVLEQIISCKFLMLLHEKSLTY